MNARAQEAALAAFDEEWRNEEVFMAFRIPGWQHVRIHRDHVEAALTKEGSTR